MAKGQNLSSYQKGVIKRYYQNKDTLASQKLGELVSELYLADSPKKLDRLWKSVETALVNAGAVLFQVLGELAKIDGHRAFWVDVDADLRCGMSIFTLTVMPSKNCLRVDSFCADTADATSVATTPMRAREIRIVTLLPRG